MRINKIIRRVLDCIKQRNFVKVGKNCDISNSIFEGQNVLFENVRVINCEIGKYSYISSNTKLFHTKIGRYCSVADNVITCLGNHPTSVFVSTFPSFYYDTTSQLGYSFHRGDALFDIRKFPQGEDKYQVVVGNDVWIGSHVLIVPGVRIGDGAIIAAGSVVSKDVEPYSIVGGVPAKIIKFRFTEQQISKLLATKWWNLPDNKVKEIYFRFQNIDSFFSDEENIINIS